MLNVLLIWSCILLFLKGLLHGYLGDVGGALTQCSVAWLSFVLFNLLFHMENTHNG